MVKRLILFILLFVAAERLCRLATHGFTVAKISSALPFNPLYETEPPPPGALLRLDQPFYFLDSGAQFYAFVGKDGKTIIKFIKHSRRRPVSWINKISLIGPLETWRINLIAERKKRLDEVMKSCLISSSTLRSETGLIYAHLNKTVAVGKKLRAIDNIGILHEIDLDQTEFLLQEKAVPWDLWVKKHPEKIEEALDNLLKLARARLEKKVALRDENVERNCGFLENRLIDLDLGSYRPLQNEDNLKKEMRHFRKWLKKNYPESVQFFDEQLKNF